jgi:NTE family protein
MVKYNKLQGGGFLNKYGLVLAGGGAKGAYQLGAWQAMRELGIEFSVVAGVSIGSINGALIASDCYEDAVSLWKNASVDRGININEELRDPENLFSFRNIPALFKEIVKNGGIDASPTKELLEEFIDEEKVRKSDIPFGMVTFQLSEFAPLEIFIDDIPEGELHDYLLASSKVPGVNKIGPEGERYLDGGVYDNAPIGFLRKYGYNRLIVVDISSMKGLAHRQDMTCAETVYIRPYDLDDLGAAFDFSEEMLEKRMRMGYLDTRKTFGYLSGRRFYFEQPVFAEMVKEFGADAVEQLEELASEAGVDKMPIYNRNSFLACVKEKIEEFRKEQQQKEEESEQRFYSALLKKLPKFNSDKEFSEALAVLDNIVV